MKTKQIIATSVAAVALAISGVALSEQPATPMVSGDEPMNVGDSAQITAPTPNAAEQAKTAEMLKQQGGELSGDMNPIDEGDAAQIKSPH